MSQKIKILFILLVLFPLAVQAKKGVIVNEQGDTVRHLHPKFNGVTVGAVRITLYPESKSGRVSALAVHPQYQGQGIAQEALLKIEKMHSDVERWFLDTILQEAGNCHLYEKLGYKITDKIEEINEKMTLVFFEKQ
jgi:ribosomal protein S18 acetylase RimI-like enzyme